ncbi:MAG: DUF3500 domain-containing protein [Planctomycetales bacterium]|nr:DUF3500 domain-containing protein [Planctomycetales bacterium]
MHNLSRRTLLKAAGVSVGMLAATQLGQRSSTLLANQTETDCMTMQLYKSLSDQQRQKVCLAVDHPRRQFVSNWWYIHPDNRIPNTFTDEQQELIQNIFDSLHNPEYVEDVKKQVKIDQYGKDQNAPAVGFFGTPEDDDFEFIYTGHHVTRRCNAHSDKGTGFGGAPIFYGHYPHPTDNMRENFNETKDHPGNPYWYQGRVFNEFVQSLDAGQQALGLVSAEPRSERPNEVVKKTVSAAGLDCSDLSVDQKQKLLETMSRMMAMFREGDVKATIASIEKNNVVDRLHVSWFGGQYDIGSDKVWDTWQIEGPDMVWYFRGQPHIHCYFHLKT